MICNLLHFQSNLPNPAYNILINERCDYINFIQEFCKFSPIILGTHSYTSTHSLCFVFFNKYPVMSSQVTESLLKHKFQV